MSEEIAQLTFDDIKTVVEKMKNFHHDSTVDAWVEKTLPALNERLEKYGVVSYKLNKDSYMGVVLDCTTKDGSRIFVKNVPSFLGRFAHEIGCLMKIPESARCVIKEFDRDTQCVVMETINPGDKAHFFENVDGYQKLFDFLNAEKTEIDDEVEADYEYFVDVLKGDYEIYQDLVGKGEIEADGKEKAAHYWERFQAGWKALSDQPMYLLHGDIHRANALIDHDGVKVIDPLGFKAPFVFEFGSVIAYEMLDSTPDKYDELMDSFMDFAKRYASEKDLAISIYCVLIKIYIPTFFEAKDGGVRNRRFLEMIEFMEKKYPEHLNF